jgi:hypothetical protein
MIEVFPGSGIPAEHPRYLPMSTKDECGERAPSSEDVPESFAYRCSRFPEHVWDHAAHGSNMRMFTRWPRRAA